MELLHDDILHIKGKKIVPKTIGQQKLIQLFRENWVTFAKGSAGTGKTFVSAALALSELVCGNIEKIILCRPAVDAGEKLGFLPGDISEKISPYLQPLYYSIESIIGEEKMNYYLQTKKISILPFAFMRGITFNDSVVLVDEAQNLSKDQLKMLLTRIGDGSKIIITGDTSQTDLRNSGLDEVSEKLKGIKGIGVVELGDEEIVRHPLIKDILNALK